MHKFTALLIIAVCCVGLKQSAAFTPATTSDTRTADSALDASASEASETSSDSSDTVLDSSNSASDANKTASNASDTDSTSSDSVSDSSNTASDSSNSTLDASKTAVDEFKTATDTSHFDLDSSNTASNSSNTSLDAPKTVSDASGTVSATSETVSVASDSSDAFGTAADAFNTGSNASVHVAHVSTPDTGSSPSAAAAISNSPIAGSLTITVNNSTVNASQLIPSKKDEQSASSPVSPEETIAADTPDGEGASIPPHAEASSDLRVPTQSPMELIRSSPQKFLFATTTRVRYTTITTSTVVVCATQISGSSCTGRRRRFLFAKPSKIPHLRSLGSSSDLSSSIEGMFAGKVLEDSKVSPSARILFNGVTIFTTSSLTVSVASGTTVTASFMCSVAGQTILFCG